MLHVFPGDRHLFILSRSNITYYPCGEVPHTPYSSSCTYFTIHHRKFNLPIYCDNCQYQSTSEKMKRQRVVTSSCRIRPFDTLTAEEKKIAYNTRCKKIKILTSKISSLVSKLHIMKESTIVPHDTPEGHYSKSNTIYIC